MRRVQLLYESNVTPAQADSLFRSAYQTARRHVGNIPLDGPSRLDLKRINPNDPFPQRLRFRAVGHRAVLTSRNIHGTKGPAAGFSDTESPNSRGIIEDSLVVVNYRPTDLLGSEATRSALRGIGDSFGLKDCGQSETRCVMGREVVQLVARPDYQPDPLLMGDPFCGNCATRLRAAAAAEASAD